MTCPFYSRDGDQSTCRHYGELTEEKAKEDCNGYFVLCLQEAREKTTGHLRDPNHFSFVRDTEDKISKESIEARLFTRENRI